MNPPIGELIVKLSALTLVFAGMAWAWWKRRGMKNEFGRLPAISDARSPGQPIVGAQRFEKVIDGTTFHCESHAGDEEIPPYLVVTILKHFFGDFSVTQVPDDQEPAWLKRLAITHVLSGDTSFDSRFNVVTDRTPAFVTACFNLPEMRDAVLDLFDRGIGLIRNDGRGMDAIWLNVPEEENQEEAITWMASRVREMAECCASGAEIQKRSIVPERWVWPWALAVPISLPFLVLAAIAGPLRKYHAQHLDEIEAFFPLELLFLTILVIPWLLVTCLAVKGRANSLTAFLGLAVFSLAGFFAAGFPLLQLANAALDQGAPTKYEQPVIDYVATDSGYRADVLSWRPERAIQPVRINEEDNAGDPLHFADCRMLAIKTKPGFFGFEWISSVRPVQFEHRPRELTPEDSH